MNANAYGTTPLSWGTTSATSLFGPVNFAYTGGVPTAAPGAPTGLAYGADGRAELTWNAVPGADNYNVYRGTAQGGLYALLPLGAGVAATAFDDRTTTNGVAYHYVVTAVNHAGESPYSNDAATTPSAPPVGSQAFVTGRAECLTRRTRRATGAISSRPARQRRRSQAWAGMW